MAKSKLDKEDKMYIQHMKIWLNERKERIKVNTVTARSLLKAAKHNDDMNVIEKQWVLDAIKEYNDFRKKKGLKPLALPKWAK